MATTSPIVWCFTAYLLSLLGFAVVYHRLYRRQRSLFLFGADLVASQRQSLQSRSERLILGLQTLQTALPAFLNAIRSGDTLATLAEKSEKTTYGIGSSFRLYKSVIVANRSKLMHLPGSAAVFVGMEVLDLDGNELLNETLVRISPRSMSDEEAIQDQLDRLADRIQGARRELSALRSPNAQIWSFWDFLYFSTVSQTTVGFGDILPNSTAVRLLVAAQIVVGYVILVVVLNILLTRYT